MVEVLIDKIDHMRAFSERGLFRKLRDSISSDKKGDYLQYLHMLVDAPIVIIDDIGSSGHTEWREEVIMELVDHLYENKMAAIFTTNFSAQEVHDTFGRRVYSRLFSKENSIMDMSELPDLRQEGL